MSWPALILSAWGDIWEEALSSGCHRTQGIYLPGAPSRPNLINPKILPSLRSLRTDWSLQYMCRTHIGKSMIRGEEKDFFHCYCPSKARTVLKLATCGHFYLHLHVFYKCTLRKWKYDQHLSHSVIATRVHKTLARMAPFRIRNQNMQIFAKIKKHKSARVLHFILKCNGSGRLFWQGCPLYNAIFEQWKASKRLIYEILTCRLNDSRVTHDDIDLRWERITTFFERFEITTKPSPNNKNQVKKSSGEKVTKQRLWLALDRCCYFL